MYFKSHSRITFFSFDNTDEYLYSLRDSHRGGRGVARPFITACPLERAEVTESVIQR